MFVMRIIFHLKRYVREKHSLSFKILVMFPTRILFYLKHSYCSRRAISFIQSVRNVSDRHLHIILHSAPRNNHYALFIYLQQISFVYLQVKYGKNRNVINSCYYREMLNVTKKNLIVIKSIIV